MKTTMEKESVQHEVYMTTMTPAEWAEVPDNPRQRDTEKRAMQAKHLHRLEAAHLLVHMAEWPGGRCKLEGHTRSKVWSDHPEIAPDQIDVRVYVVSGPKDAKYMYGHFNSREEAETSNDRLFGAMREWDIEPQSTFVRSAKFSNAVRTAFAYLRGAWSSTDAGNTSGKPEAVMCNVYESVAEFTTEINALDRMDFSKQRALGAVVCCYFMAYRKHGHRVNEFFARYMADAGQKDGKYKDCVQLFADAMEQFRLVGTSFQTMNDACGAGLACIDRWIKSPEAKLSRSPKCNPFQYLD